jgi:membrane-bound serine protease (ClpP class)
MMRPKLFSAVLFGWLLSVSVSAQAGVWLVELEGAIGPALAHHLDSSLSEAEAAGVELVVLRLDTPGGLDTAMRDMIRRILGAQVPVATWVGPSGARAASAGTYLLYASHIAAMAPGTNLGAATPVQIGGMPSLPGTDQEESAPTEGGAMERKVINDAVAYIRGLAALRGRNADWAEQAVREGASLPASEALASEVIDLVAETPQALLDQLQGREVQVGERRVTLDVAGQPLETRAMDKRSEFLAIITNPNIAYILLMVGIYGLIIEFYNRFSFRYISTINNFFQTWH